MYFEIWILIMCENRKGRVACAGTHLEKDTRAVIRLCDLSQDGEFLLKPLPVLEKVGGIIFVEVVPPFGGIGIESV